MNVSDYIAEFIFSKGIHCVFQVTGGMIAPLIDSIAVKGKMQLVNTHHEQAAAFAAEGFARIKHLPGFALATSGPGAINLLTGIGSCYFDSVPAIFITGQVNRSELKGTKAIRQLGFQEADIVSMAAPITKAAFLLLDHQKIPEFLNLAFQISLSGRPGPVLIDIPIDVLRSEVNPDSPSHVSVPFEDHLSSTDIEDLFHKLRHSERPLIIVGGGVHSANAANLCRSFIEKVKVPVVNSLMAADILPYSHYLRVGMIGTYGNRWANRSVAHSDFLIVLGSRLDIRQTGADTKAFKGNRIIFHVDCDSSEINNRIHGCYPVIADLKEFFLKANYIASNCTFSDRTDWLAEINRARNETADTDELREISGINPNRFMHQLSSFFKLNEIYVIDVGQNQMWSAQSLELVPGQRFLTTGGMGAMGFALPAAIGASFACSNNNPIIMIAGDGGFQLNIQELQTVFHHWLPIKMVVLNNRCYGLVRQFQESYFNERYHSTCWDYSAPDFAGIAKSYGIPSYTVNEPSNVFSGLSKLVEDLESPFLLQVMLDRFTNVYPKMAFGRSLTEMEPLLDASEIDFG